MATGPAASAASALLKAKNGTANFCLDPEARKAFDAAGISMTDGRYLIAHDVPLNLTTEGADAFTTTFGTSPVVSGKPLFIGTGYGELEAGELPLVPNLVPVSGTSSAERSPQSPVFGMGKLGDVAILAARQWCRVHGPGFTSVVNVAQNSVAFWLCAGSTQVRLIHGCSSIRRRNCAAVCSPFR